MSFQWKWFDVINIKDPQCKTVTRAKMTLRAKVSACKIVCSCKNIPSCKSVFVQK